MEYKINQELLSQLDAEIDAMMSEVVENRRYLHMHPEIGFDTVGTEKMVKKILSDNQIEILNTKLGVLGVIPGKNRKRMIALRADMDALCLQEENDVPYKSLYENKMHACGHDGHTAMLLGAAKLLQRHREELETDVLLIFQPAEEGPTPGGAKLILEEMKKLGFLEKTERIFGQHLFNNYPCGMVGYKFGAKASSTDEFYIKSSAKAVMQACRIRQSMRCQSELKLLLRWRVSCQGESIPLIRLFFRSEFLSRAPQSILWQIRLKFRERFDVRRTRPERIS